MGCHTGHHRNSATLPRAPPANLTSPHATKRQHTVNTIPIPLPEPCITSLSFSSLCASPALSYVSLLPSNTSFLFTIITVLLPISHSHGGSLCCRGGVWLAPGCACSPSSAILCMSSVSPSKPSKALGFSSETTSPRCFHPAVRKPTQPWGANSLEEQEALWQVCRSSKRRAEASPGRWKPAKANGLLKSLPARTGTGSSKCSSCWPCGEAREIMRSREPGRRERSRSFPGVHLHLITEHHRPRGRVTKQVLSFFLPFRGILEHIRFTNAKLVLNS